MTMTVQPNEKTTALARIEPPRGMTHASDFGAEHMRIVREAFAPTASQAEFEVMWAGAKARGLDPVKKQIFFIKRWDSMRNADVWSSQVSIDGFRSIAVSSDRYDGQDEPEFEYEAEGRLILARVRVYRKGVGRPFVGVARWNEYVQTTRQGQPTQMWKKMEHTMLGKCAEALALRKAFPEFLGGLHTSDELEQADSEGTLVPRPDVRVPAPAVVTAKDLMDRIAEAEDDGALHAVLRSAPSWPRVRANAWRRLIERAEDVEALDRLRALYEADVPADICTKLDDLAGARFAPVEAPR
jgi:phage recombination protein Bet